MSGRDKKVRILDAAATLVSREGLQSFSFENIARESGMSRQLIRYYYADLDALIIDLCDRLGGSYQNILVTGVVEVGQVERLGFFLDFFFGLAEKYPMPDHLEAYDSLLAFAVGSPKLKARLCDQYKMLGQVIIHELAIAHPELSEHARAELSYLFVAMMHAHWSFVASLGHTPDHGRAMRKAIDRLILSYTQDTEPDPQVERPWARED